ncbi:type 1 glutamine amidotransferase domain-containing protein [Sphingomonas sp. 28-63-12]|uniref:type 1 glutamine amidotransferase domain-containing protein n=1 Tax=Sphingomonas sp. 28-63-12 TaxID=1970434 RepID=UPI000BD8CF2E|nr:MAG: peptidase C56 [Sphingomonas sp. 28-63-12]
MSDITNARVLFLATDGFEQSELFSPREALIDAGAHVTLASIGTDPIQGMKHDEKAETITPDLMLHDVDANDYDALVLPGGVANPDTMRLQPKAIAIIQAFFDDDKTVAAICHAPWLLIEADVVDGRRLASWPSLHTDLENAGAEVVDAAVVIDGNLITSRNPDDLPAFNAALIEAINEQVSESA